MSVKENTKNKEKQKMRVRINTHGNRLPEKAPGGDWYDMRASETVSMKAGEVKVILQKLG